MISPELALVDPELREQAISLLPAYPPASAAATRVEAAPAPAHVRRRLLVGTLAYVAAATARILVLDALFVLAIAALVLAANLFG